MSVPFIGFSNETLEKLPKVDVGDIVSCSKCGAVHVLEAADDGSTLLLFYRCKDKLYLGAVGGRCVANVKSDVSGHMPDLNPTDKDN